MLKSQKDNIREDVSFGSIKTNKLINITVNGISKGINYHQIIENLKEKLSVKDDEFSIAQKYILTKKDHQNTFRGKNQLDFFVALINILKKLNDTSSFFSKKRASVTINLTSNRLSELSQYALFPTCLKEFIASHQNHKSSLQKADL